METPNVDLCAQGDKTEKSKVVLTSVFGNDNGELIKEVARIYLKPDDQILDVTYGKGVFWKQIDTSKYRFYPSDIKGDGLLILKNDFRELPYRDNDFDVVVFDPPYMHSGAGIKKSIDKCYNNSLTTIKNHKDVIDLYMKGMLEAHRILKPKGLMWVKCKDEIESGKQKMSHIEIHDIATWGLKMTVEDLFIFTQKSVPCMREKYQLHGRKNHSYLFIFRK